MKQSSSYVQNSTADCQFNTGKNAWNNFQMRQEIVYSNNNEHRICYQRRLTVRLVRLALIIQTRKFGRDKCSDGVYMQNCFLRIVLGAFG